VLDPRESSTTVFFVFNTYLITNYPRHPLADFLKKPTPNPIVIPPVNQRNNHKPALVYPNAYNRLKNFLKDMLCEKLERLPMDFIGPAFKNLSCALVVANLRSQLEAFWWNEWLFDQQVEGNDPLAWWRGLEENRSAQVLAVHA